MTVRARTIREAAANAPAEALQKSAPGRGDELALVINLRTGKALGLAIPPALLQRADHVSD